MTEIDMKILGAAERIILRLIYGRAENMVGKN
jgi:hypothetical protein